jgi:hypothetical protein
MFHQEDKMNDNRVDSAIREGTSARCVVLSRLGGSVHGTGWQVYLVCGANSSRTGAKAHVVCLA